MALVSPAELARLLGLPEPTAEQAQVISAPLAPMAVVAGAGSGKSETMAARVVWLVANGMVRPERVLGLTFTRKATAELAARVRRRLDQLRGTGLVDDAVLDGEPTVSTYNAYAARLFGDHALREAYEPTMRLITPAVAWQLASQVVDAYDGPMDAVAWQPATVTKAVIELAGELAEHLRTPGEVREVGDWLRTQLDRLPKVTKAQRDPLANQEVREQLLPLVEAYIAAKAEREVLDYGDQVAITARIAQRHPEVGLIERSRYGVVLLDEYQDTSHAQLVLLRSLFGAGSGPAADGHPVTAVGDPCQSIYGWRGASAGNLLRFPHDFPSGGRPAPVAQLSVSFRNGERILDAAARVQEELRAEARAVPRLRPGPDRRGTGRVECALYDTVEEEAARVADRIAALLSPDRARDRARDVLPDRPLEPSDIAVLVRKRAQLPALRRALEERGVPVEVVGLGGLLTVPEVADVVATLRVLRDPSAGAALVRLLTGPRWRIGPADLVALGRRARELARMDARDVAADRDTGDRDTGDRATDDRATGDRGADARDAEGRDVDGVRAGEPAAPAGGPGADPADPLRRVVEEMTGEVGSLIDALDDLGHPERYSAEGYRRLSALARELRGLRTQLGQPLPDLITDVERTLGLDVEVAARAGRGDPAAARADLDAFIDAAAKFAGAALHETGSEPTLGAFLAYLKAAEEEERGLDAGRVGETNTVKLMTIHGAKGLEWPVVVLPGLCQRLTKAGKPVQGSLFPASPMRPTRWTDNARLLPYPLRGDRDDLPVLKGLTKDDLAEFTAACADRDLREERRLAYVAVTRASHLLIASGYRWGAGGGPLDPSMFLTELREACAAGAGEVVTWAPAPAEDADNPLLAEPASAPWPTPPPEEDERWQAIAAGARMVEDAMRGDTRPWSAGAYADLTDAERRTIAAWARDVELLLAERDRGRRGDALAVELPAHLSVSSLVTLARDPAALARQIRRPMPRPPAPYARRGTAFHRWLESRWGQQRLLDPDDLPGAADEGAADDADLAELQAAFERSAWADREPVDVEVPFETLIGDRLIRGRMDAVFRSADGGYEVVDWKTGAEPTAEDAEAAAVQLAAYRLAWAELADVPVERVSAAFHYVRANRTVRPADLLDAEGLAALIERLPTG